MPILKLVPGHSFIQLVSLAEREKVLRITQIIIRQCFCDLKSHKEVSHSFKIQFVLFLLKSYDTVISK